MKPGSGRSGRAIVIASLIGMASACGRERDMPEKAEVSDSTPVMRAMTNRKAADSMLDTMPGGEMARGDSASATRLLKRKM